MSELDAAARAAGYETTAEVRMTHRGTALVALPGEEDLVRVPADEITGDLGVPAGDLPGMRLLVMVRETPETGRVLSGWRLPG